MSDVNAIRRAIMISMSMTGERFKTRAGNDLYSHDDYDAAHAALNDLVLERKQLRDALILLAENTEAYLDLERDGAKNYPKALRLCVEKARAVFSRMQ